MVKKALSWPARQIAINAGEDGSVVVGKKASSKTSCRTGSSIRPRWSAPHCRMRLRLRACSSLLRRWSPRDLRRRHRCLQCPVAAWVAWIIDRRRTSTPGRGLGRLLGPYEPRSGDPSSVSRKVLASVRLCALLGRSAKHWRTPLTARSTRASSSCAAYWMPALICERHRMLHPN